MTLERIFYIGFFFFFFAFSVKSSIITLRTWLQNAPGEAHSSARMLLARIFLKMGAYGRDRYEIITLSAFYILYFKNGGIWKHNGNYICSFCH